MADKTCPSCGADLVVATTGALQGKILKCEFCGYQEDLPDDVQVHGHARKIGAGISPYPPGQAIDDAMDAVGEDAPPDIREALEKAQQAVASVQAAVEAAPWTPPAMPEPMPVVREVASRAHRIAVLAVVGCLGVALIAALTIIAAVFILGR